MSLPAGQVADKIYLPAWRSILPRATGQQLMSHPERQYLFADGMQCIWLEFSELVKFSIKLMYHIVEVVITWKIPARECI